MKMSEIRARFPMYKDVSDEQLLIALRQKFYPDVPMGQFARQVEFDTQRVDPTKDMSWGEKFAAGAGKAITDTGRGLGQMVGAVSREDVADSRALDASLMNTGAGMTGNVAGNIGMALMPGGVVAGAGKVASKVPQLAAAAPALQAAGSTLLAPKSIPAALAVGAGQGLVQPSTSTSETVLNTGVGSAASAFVPAAIRGGEVAKSFAEPFYEKGQAQILGRALRKSAGAQADDALRNLREASAPFTGPQQGTPKTMMGEYVPGSLPTAGEAAQNPGIAALQRTASALDPSVMNDLAARQAANNQARSTLLTDLSGADGRRMFMEEAREATANQMYGKARKVGVDMAALSPQAQANIADFQKRVPKEIMDRARELAKIKGIDLDNESSVQGMHWVKKALDSKIGVAKRTGDDEMARAYMGLKEDLLKGMDEMSPLYQQARKTYAEMSKPINEMEVIDSIRTSATAPLTGKVQPAAYARALSDRTAQNVTRMPTATLENSVGQQSRQSLDALKDDLARENFANTAGRGVGSDTVQKLAYANMLDKSGLPTFIRDMGPAGVVGNVMGRAADLGYKRANDEMSRKLARALLDPQDTASLMESGMVTPQMQALIEGLKRSGAAVGGSAPYMLNAGKE